MPLSAIKVCAGPQPFLELWTLHLEEPLFVVLDIERFN